MSKYNILKKELVSFDEMNPISDLEYMLLTEEDITSPFVLVKLMNQTEKVLINVEISVEYKDVEGISLGVFDFCFENLNVEPNQSKMLSDKIKLIEHSDSIDFVIKSVETKEEIWSEGVWVEKPKTIKREAKPLIAVDSFEVETITPAYVGFPYIVPIGLFVILTVTIIFVFFLINS